MNLHKDIFVFIGPPGSGKGSLSNLCVRQLNWVQLSTGNLCRKHIVEQTDIGKEIAIAIKSGKLISDSLITSMVESWLAEQIEYVPAVILDGFPRAVAQAEALDKAIKQKFNGLTLCIVKFSISDDQVISRLTGRLICRNSDCQAVYSSHADSMLQPKKAMVCDHCAHDLTQREDDEAHAIRERLSIYHKYTHDLLNFYHGTGQQVFELNAEVPPTQIFEDFKKIVGLKRGLTVK